MLKTKLLIAGLALLFLAMPARVRADACPAIGYASGCNIIITFGAGGSISTVLGDPNAYDGLEDQLVGVVNNSGSTLSSISLTGSDIFGFDGDGAGEPGVFCTVDLTGGTHGCLAGGTFGPSGYEGPNTSFTVTDFDNGKVNFTGGLASGSTAWFSLEEPASLQGLVVGGGGGGGTGVPEPSSILLLGSGLVSLFGLARRRLTSLPS
jgi:PEP-CTERM motif